MIKIILLCSILITGCATAADLAVQSVAGAIGGAIGNMADRRMERALGNDPAKEDAKREPILRDDKEFSVVDENGKTIK